MPWDEVLDGPEPVEPSDAELLGVWPDPFAGRPDGADAWLADLSAPDRWADADELGAAGDGAVGFEAGGVLDTMEPGPILAGFVADASAAGLSQLSDDQLVGLLCVARRLSSWQMEVEFRVVAELDHRRRHGSDIVRQSRPTG